MDAIVNSGLGVCALPGSGAGTVDTASASGITEAYPTALDAYSFSLHYYPQDYKPIGQTTPVIDPLQALGSSAAPLYNGNIAAMAVVLNPALDTPLVYNYHYDQLNRLAQMDAYKGLNYVNHTFTPVHLQDYQERPTYDPNGNITTYVRHGYGSNIPMDSLTYNYYGGYNRLQRINDGAGGSYTTDLKDQGSGNNYTYDSIGNLKRDSANNVKNIDWTVYGKIADLIHTANDSVIYTYDAAGNRITKKASGTTTVYVRDAQGNILSIYSWPGSGSATQKEVDLYGSSRLGSVGPLTVAPTTVSIGTGYGPATLSTFTRGEKSYELSNHLGNILTTITDKKIAVPSTTNSSLIDHFTADIATAQDYYPFGMLMPGRTYPGGTSSYRYGFNGKEQDPEVEGTGNFYDYGMRGYDPRIGRFLSVDPLKKKYPELTPYQFASNRPIQGVDRDGEEFADPNVAIFYWLFVKPFETFNEGALNIAQGTVQKTVAETGQASYNNDHVPHEDQQRLVQNDELGGTAKQVFGLGQVVQASADVSTTYTPIFMEGLFSDASARAASGILGLFEDKAATPIRIPFTPEASAAADLADKSRVLTAGGEVGVLNGAGNLSVNAKEGTFEIIINSGDETAKITGNLNVKDNIIGFEDLEITNVNGGLGSIQKQGSIGFSSFNQLTKELGELTKAAGYENGYAEFSRSRPPGSKLSNSETRRIYFDQSKASTPNQASSNAGQSN